MGEGIEDVLDIIRRYPARRRAEDDRRAILSLRDGDNDGLLNADGLGVARRVVDSLRDEGAARSALLADGEAIDIP